MYLMMFGAFWPVAADDFVWDLIKRLNAPFGARCFLSRVIILSVIVALFLS